MSPSLNGSLNYNADLVSDVINESKTVCELCKQAHLTKGARFLHYTHRNTAQHERTLFHVGYCRYSEVLIVQIPGFDL